MRLIDANALQDQYIAKMEEVVKSTTTPNISLEALSLLCGYTLIMDAPTIEVEPVIQCKDCKYLNKEEMRCFEVEGLGYRNVADDDFCSRGKRKDDGRNG